LGGDARPYPYRALYLGEAISRTDAEVALDELVESGQVPDDTYQPVVVTVNGQEMTWLAGDRPGDQAYAVRRV
jgi:hypothetical protein